MKKRCSLISLLLLFTLVLSACGFGGGSDSGKKGSEGKDTLNINIKTEPFSLNPGLANDSVSSNVLRQTFEGLTTIDKDGKPVEATAEKIEVSKDKKTYTFTIRDGAKWSNGDPVTAQDFEYAWKWALDPKNQSQYAYQLYYLKGGEAANKGKGKIADVGVKALDDKTLKVELEKPTPYFTELTAFYTYLPVNKKVAEKNPKWYTDAGENYVSNGPFKMTKWKHSGNIVLEKNDQYWDKGAVKLKKINIAMVNDANTGLNMYKKGETDYVGEPLDSIPTDAVPSLKNEGLKVDPFASVYMYKFNTEKAPFNNVNIRKALTYAINREALVKNVTQADEIPATKFIPPVIHGFESKEGYFKDHDVDKAKEYLQKGLKELGLNKASELPKITLSYNTDNRHQQVAQAIQEMWNKDLGVKAELSNEEWNVYIDKVHSGNYQIARMGWIADFNDAMTFLETYRDKDGGNNDTNWENAKYKELLTKASVEPDADKRMKLMKEAEGILMDELPIAPIFFYTMPHLHDEHLKGYVLLGTGEIYFKTAYFE
ncbi:peptide ABC transporter substrate-binding protein [Bacillus sp. WMMC1349]|uniref:peptide ABC transporter substrate-binding protein n=1 Tax=Bacillus sp. WMMC1349 TaxID=2736254 RepID=UPI00155601A2|nr:peptide ABC transporter substrate-binding protein [Bacillus sp. WMMC1349]NPC92188.1 peptide ABC transporter substrate-binding protein [Bacillus sp. WMMC1349]